MFSDELDKLKVTIASTFVPLSQSRNAGEKYPTVNWKVTLLKDGKRVLTTDYQQGIAHLKGYEELKRKKEVFSIYGDAQIRAACEGKTNFPQHVRVIPPTKEEVFSSLTNEYDSLSYSCFEDWADSYGYESDSRKAEDMYRVCLDITLKLRNAFGESTMQTLCELAREEGI
jgi:hypothetical protein